MKTQKSIWLNKIESFLQTNNLSICQHGGIGNKTKNLYIKDNVDKHSPCATMIFGTYEQCYYKLVEWFTQTYSVSQRPFILKYQ